MLGDIKGFCSLKTVDGVFIGHSKEADPKGYAEIEKDLVEAPYLRIVDIGCDGSLLVLDPKGRCLCGESIEKRPYYAQVFDYLSKEGYNVVVHQPFIPKKRWTASVHLRTKDNTLVERQIKDKREGDSVEYLEFDDWREAADRGILLALELMNMYSNSNLKVERLINIEP